MSYFLKADPIWLFDFSFSDFEPSPPLTTGAGRIGGYLKSGLPGCILHLMAACLTSLRPGPFGFSTFWLFDFIYFLANDWYWAHRVVHGAGISPLYCASWSHVLLSVGQSQFGSSSFLIFDFQFPYGWYRGHRALIGGIFIAARYISEAESLTSLRPTPRRLFGYHVIHGSWRIGI